MSLKRIIIIIQYYINVIITLQNIFIFYFCYFAKYSEHPT